MGADTEVPALEVRRGKMWREVRMSDERARFLEEESEERIEQDFLAGEIAA